MKRNTSEKSNMCKVVSSNLAGVTVPETFPEEGNVGHLINTLHEGLQCSARLKESNSTASKLSHSDESAALVGFVACRGGTLIQMLITTSVLRTRVLPELQSWAEGSSAFSLYWFWFSSNSNWPRGNKGNNIASVADKLTFSLWTYINCFFH